MASRRTEAGRTIVLALVAASALGGCAVLTIGAPLAAETYYRNAELEVVVDAYHAEVLAASVTVLEELDFEIKAQHIGEIDGSVVGRTPWGEAVTIGATQETGVNTTLTIRVGLLGDVALSWDIYRGIKRDLYRNGLIDLGRARPSVVAVADPH